MCSLRDSVFQMLDRSDDRHLTLNAITTILGIEADDVLMTTPRHDRSGRQHDGFDPNIAWLFQHTEGQDRVSYISWCLYWDTIDVLIAEIKLRRLERKIKAVNLTTAQIY